MGGGGIMNETARNFSILIAHISKSYLVSENAPRERELFACKILIYVVLVYPYYGYGVI